MKSVFLGVTSENLLIPVICGRNHWCSIMLDLTAKEVFVHDPMNLSYGVKARLLAEKLVVMLPNFAPRQYWIRPYRSDFGVQVDNYNCGMYMLSGFEAFAGTESLRLLSRKELQ
ncbi:hypothetical protein L917_16993 [Phytophthora nicotianae]|uniref:Ubiquitin-like protease family profile domain-containing protein n=1 Tax=Phytophthora nicotianae TaxID=4792 RepID=W2KCY9_PHYNI|nr:hypothetical protein L917_16993 [Phytophthora nicotianae]